MEIVIHYVCCPLTRVALRFWCQGAGQTRTVYSIGALRASPLGNKPNYKVQPHLMPQRSVWCAFERTDTKCNHFSLITLYMY